MVDLSINWVLFNPNVSTVLIGPRNIDQLDQYINSLNFRLQYNKTIDKSLTDLLPELPKTIEPH